MYNESAQKNTPQYIQPKHLGYAGKKALPGVRSSVSSVVEFPGAGLSRLRAINSELNGATQPFEAATEAGRASVNFTT